MRNCIALMTSILLSATLCMALNACQRSMSESERNISELQATHPWQLPAGAANYQNRLRPGSQEVIPPDGEVVRPAGRGPAFSSRDSLDVGLLPGSWVMVGISAEERLDLRSNKDYSSLVLQQNGMFRVHFYVDGEVAGTVDGNWAKTAPGVLTLVHSTQTGQSVPVDMHCEMFGTDFLFMWSYSEHRGYWYTRQVLEEPELVIGYNRYTSGLGDFVFTNSGQQSYYGELTTPEGSVWQLNGYLVDGILNMAWVDGQNKASGFATFIVEDNWNRLRGTYWKNFYEAAPFTDEWLAEADR